MPRIEVKLCEPREDEDDMAASDDKEDEADEDEADEAGEKEEGLGPDHSIMVQQQLQLLQRQLADQQANFSAQTQFMMAEMQRLGQLLTTRAQSTDEKNNDDDSNNQARFSPGPLLDPLLLAQIRKRASEEQQEQQDEESTLEELPMRSIDSQGDYEEHLLADADLLNESRKTIHQMKQQRRIQTHRDSGPTFGTDNDDEYAGIPAAFLQESSDDEDFDSDVDLPAVRAQSTMIVKELLEANADNSSLFGMFRSFRFDYGE